MAIFLISDFFFDVLKYIGKYWFLFAICVILIIALVSLIVFYSNLFGSFKAFISSDEQRIHQYTQSVLKQHEDDFPQAFNETKEETEENLNIEDILKLDTASLLEQKKK